MRYILTFILFLPFFACAGEPTEEQQREFEKSKEEFYQYYSQYDGLWEGELVSHELQGDHPDKPFKFYIYLGIKGEEVQVFERANGKTYELGYQFNIIRNGPNAIIYSHAKNSGWVESFAFTITLETKDELGVSWSRVVNNFMAPEKTKEARGYFQGFTIFKSVKKT